MAGKRKRVYVYEPVLFDRMSGGRCPKGAKVVKTQPYGCPKNGTMGMCYVQDAETGAFYGLVMLNSLEATNEMAVERDLAAEARDRRSAELFGDSEMRYERRVS